TSSDASAARDGSAPISFMMYDIAALQQMYGVNYSGVGATRIYKWDATTGQQTINGVAAPDTGITGTNKIFSTVWTQGATSTYDLSNFSDDAILDMRPGQWMAFSKSQIADLNSDAAAGTAKYQAQGNIYNALLFNGDTKSEINNLIAGA